MQKMKLPLLRSRVWLRAYLVIVTVLEVLSVCVCVHVGGSESSTVFKPGGGAHGSL